MPATSTVAFFLFSPAKLILPLFSKKMACSLINHSHISLLVGARISSYFGTSSVSQLLRSYELRPEVPLPEIERPRKGLSFERRSSSGSN